MKVKVKKLIEARRIQREKLTEEEKLRRRKANRKFLTWIIIIAIFIVIELFMYNWVAEWIINQSIDIIMPDTFWQEFEPDNPLTQAQGDQLRGMVKQVLKIFFWGIFYFSIIGLLFINLVLAFLLSILSLGLYLVSRMGVKISEGKDETNMIDKLQEIRKENAKKEEKRKEK